MRFPIAILAGGLATRLKPLTETIPKALVEVAGKPFVVHQLELLRQHGFKDVVLCVGHLGEQVEAVLGDGIRWGLKLSYAFDGPKLLGTGGALRCALPLLGDNFFVLYGDSYLMCDYAAIQQTFLSKKKSGLMTVFRNTGLWDRSNVLFQNDEITWYDKQQPMPAMQHIDYGLGVFKAQVFEDYEPDKPFDLAGVYQGLLTENDLAAFEVAQRFYEIGSHEGLNETQVYLTQKKESDA
jgi:N-acetyl-alpha-D-muramate 1-phosphate uridylyltransferase